MGKKSLLSNPWSSISLASPRCTIASIDETYFNANFDSPALYEAYVNKKYPEAKLTFEPIPAPFSGDKKANVYCLNKNPGRPDPCFKGIIQFEQAKIEQLQLKGTSCFWAEPFTDKNGKQHAGAIWTRQRTRELKTILGRDANIFFVEFFPYHSTKGFLFPCHLPSYDFTNQLIEQAMDEGKLIVIMREKQRWFHRIPKLEEYHNLAILKAPQGGYLTLKNLVWANKGATLHLTVNDVKKYF